MLQRVLASAAKLQEVVPEAVLVGGSAAALHAGHRDSFVHDHVLADLVDRSGEQGSVLTSLVISLAGPRPRDTDVIDELPRYKGLSERYHRWADVVEISRSLALRLSGAGE